MTRRELIQNVVSLEEWTGELISTLSLTYDGKNDQGAASLYNCHLHSRAITILIQNNHDLSAMALLRVQFESYIRGMYILYCCDTKIDNNYRFPKMETMHQAVRDSYFQGDERFSTICSRYYCLTSDFTHNGYRSIQTTLQTGEIGAPNDDEQAIEVIRVSTTFSLLACQALAVTCCNNSAATQLLHRYSSFFENIKQEDKD